MSGPNLKEYFKAVDTLGDSFVDRLKDAIAIPSVSSDPQRRHELVRMVSWLGQQLKQLGAETTIEELGEQPGHPELALPPVLIGRYGRNPAKKTVLVYGHYDVQPASESDGWGHDPFLLTIDNQGRMHGRGSTDDKGPVLAWINSIQAYQASGQELPVNLVMCFEGMEESGSTGLGEFLAANTDKYFSDVDAICISDSCWLGKKPTLVYGLRGMNYYSVGVSGPKLDLHSGVFGGAIREPMDDLLTLLTTLNDSTGAMAIPGITDLVAPVTEDEKRLYESIDFCAADLEEAVGSETSRFQDKEKILMNRWRFPSLSIHGIEGAFSEKGTKTVIPARVIGKFSIRSVPNMESAETTRLVRSHVQKTFDGLGSKNKLDFNVLHSGEPWVADYKHWNFESAANAIRDVWGVDPDYVREGGSIPVAVTIQTALNKNIVLLPMGACDDAAHSANEKLDLKN